MKRETLIQIILGTIGGLIFALGMCMCLVEEWNAFAGGVVTSIIGFIILLCIIPVYRVAHPARPRKPIDGGLLLAWTVGIAGSLLMGFGMSKIMVGNVTGGDLAIGLIFGIIGLIICVLNYPVYAYIKGNK